MGRPDQPDASMYTGPEPLSELCCRAIAQELQQLHSLSLFIDLHSHGQKWMFPHGYSAESCPHHTELLEAARAAARAVESVHGRKYEVLQASRLEMPVGGTVLDWVYKELKVPHCYVVELRPEFLSKWRMAWALLTQGKSAYFQGFELPEKEIREVGEEIFAGIVEIGRLALKTRDETQD